MLSGRKEIKKDQVQQMIDLDWKNDGKLWKNKQIDEKKHTRS